MNILQPYFDGLKKRQLLLPYCTSCGKTHFYPRHACPHCWEENYEWKPACGLAKVTTHSRVLANPPSHFEALLPFDIAIVALEEGVTMLTNLIESPGIQIGDTVSLSFIERAGSVLPVFKKI
jgi:uncharacterized OB-fold protein